jgi:hypothetical protein
MDETSPKGTRKTLLTFLAIGFSVATTGAGGWFYYDSRLRDIPPPPARAPQAYRPMARVMVAPQPSTTPSMGVPGEPSFLPSNAPERPIFHVLERRHLDDFREDLKKKVLDQLAPTYPELQSVLKDREEGSSEAPYQRVAFELLETAKKAPADQRPAILFAADLVAQRVWCAFENKGECDQLRADFARYQLTLARAELGGVFIYPHDLLWRLWREYPATDWGERAFVLLLDSGWDTSGICEKGEDQTREVIRQGESFLRQRPSSPYRGVVALLVGEAYASWWSLGNEPNGSDMSGYIDRKQFKEGADTARMNAIGYFEEVVRLSPDTGFSQFALEVLPPLHDQQILDNYRFYCVYD